MRSPLALKAVRAVQGARERANERERARANTNEQAKDRDLADLTYFLNIIDSRRGNRTDGLFLRSCSGASEVGLFTPV